MTWSPTFTKTSLTVLPEPVPISPETLPLSPLDEAAEDVLLPEEALPEEEEDDAEVSVPAGESAVSVEAVEETAAAGIWVSPPTILP